MSYLTDQVLSDVEETILSFASVAKHSSLMDIGCWDGRATARYALACGANQVSGIEIFADQVSQARERGIDVHKVDLERGILPLSDNSFELVICNQVFEHIKGVFDLLSEIHRILKPGGHFIFSVPNLASLHNRLLLLLGMQPTSIRIVGPHVRGFSYRHTKKFLLLNDLFEIVESRGCGFYPFPISVGRHVGRIWPGASHTFVHNLRKTESNDLNWTEVVRKEGYQTVYSA